MKTYSKEEPEESGSYAVRNKQEIIENGMLSTQGNFQKYDWKLENQSLYILV